MKHVLFISVIICLQACTLSTYYYYIPECDVYIRVEDGGETQKVSVSNNISSFYASNDNKEQTYTFFNVRNNAEQIYLDIPFNRSIHYCSEYYGLRGDMNAVSASPYHCFVIIEPYSPQILFDNAISVQLPIKNKLVYYGRFGELLESAQLNNASCIDSLLQSKPSGSYWRDWCLPIDAMKCSTTNVPNISVIEEGRQRIIKYGNDKITVSGGVQHFYINKKYPDYIFYETRPWGALNKYQKGSYKYDGESATVIQTDLIDYLYSCQPSQWIRIISTFDKICISE